MIKCPFHKIKMVADNVTIKGAVHFVKVSRVFILLKDERRTI